MVDVWVRGPFGLEAGRGRTLSGERTVLAVVHHPAAATRLMDVLPLLEEDRRVQVVFTVAPSSLFARGGEDAARRFGGVVIGWEQARQCRFDLAIAAGQGQLDELHAPVMTFPHGVGGNKLRMRWDRHGQEAARSSAPMDPERLLHRGRVVATMIVLGSRWHRDRLAAVCPPALPAALVAGDPCFDRILASQVLREAYREALGVGDGRRLVVVSSTWSSFSALGQDRELLADLVEQLPADRYQLVAVLHPNIWSWHGRRQVAAWYASCVRRGLVLLPPEEGWRAALVAADLVVGDHGSVTNYGAALGRPVVLAAHPRSEVAPGSQAAELAKIAPRLQAGRPFGPQIDEAMVVYRPGWYRPLRAMLTSAPGRAAPLIRRAMYRLLELPEPELPACSLPVPLPEPVGVPGALGGPW